MIEIHGIKLQVTKSQKDLEREIMRKLHIKYVPQYKILKRSIDARKKPDVYYVYSIGVSMPHEKELVHKIHNNNIMLTKETNYTFPKSGSEVMLHHPLIIGAGPAGLFCALLLARMGYVPIIVERGMSVEDRSRVVEEFFEGAPLRTDCNVQFGEGGAGTFSDGKLNTQVKDKYGRIRYVLETFVRHGADPSILYDSKPHVGTDQLRDVVKGIREEIESYGGIFQFRTRADEIKVEDGRIKAVKLVQDQQAVWVASEQVVFAIGHSARDTFSMLYDHAVSMRQKNFAMGVRIEHPAEWIQRAMYGEGEAAKSLPAAPYKLTYQTSRQRGVYSFCMCPGGYVVNASSEEDGIAVNGMSYSGRDGCNSNSALVVTVQTTDFESEHPLAGIELQRRLERNVYYAGAGRIVVQRYEDFCSNRASTGCGEIVPQIKGRYCYGNLRQCLPDFIGDALEEAIPAFEKRIPGFAHPDVILSGVESRTSSPVRIERNDRYSSNIEGLYPCGEGAGYAGGIVSAAVDGMKVAEAIIQQFQAKEERNQSR